MRICLDAGHTSKATNHGVCAGHDEAKLMWKLHLLLKEKLERYENVTVHTFRKSIDEEVPKPKSYTVNVGRGKQCADDDIFISLHDNACDTESVVRPVIIPSIQRSPNRLATELADRLEKLINDALGTNQKAQIWFRSNTTNPNWSWYGVLMGAEMVGKPAVIIEHSFHTNRAYCEWVTRDGSLEKLAEADAQAIAAAYNLKPKQIDEFDVDDMYTIKAGDVYTNGVKVPSRLVGKSYRVRSVKPEAVLLDVINSWVVVPKQTVKAEPNKTETIKVEPKYYTLRDGDVYTNGVRVPKRLIGTVCTIADRTNTAYLLKEINSWVVHK